MNEPIEEESTGVLLNRCYGGFTISDEAIELFNKRSDTPFELMYDINRGNLKMRTDELLLQILYEIGSNRFSGTCSSISQKCMLSKYKEHYQINDYDGCESLIIHYDKYKLDSIYKIIDSTLSSDDKIFEIHKIQHQKK